jgi:hypothetical protein
MYGVCACAVGANDAQQSKIDESGKILERIEFTCSPGRRQPWMPRQVSKTAARDAKVVNCLKPNAVGQTAPV